MLKKNKIINEGGVNGSGTGVVNVNSQDYKALQKIIVEQAKQQTMEERIEYAFLSLKFQMESYLSEQKPNKIVSTGYYLQEHLKVVGIKGKDFAKYTDIEESRISSIVRGQKKINIDTARIFGEVFKTGPDIWYFIENKNELLKPFNRKKNKKYRLEDLLKMKK